MKKEYDIIQLTEEYGVQLVVATNLEVLGINANDPEVGQEAVSAAQDYLFDRIEAFANCESSFGFFNGNHAGMEKCGGLFYAFYRRDIEDQSVSGGTDTDDLWYTDWCWIDIDEVPPILIAGIEVILDEADSKMMDVIDRYNTN